MQHGPLRNAYLDALGIDRWVPRTRRSKAIEPDGAPPQRPRPARRAPGCGPRPCPLAPHVPLPPASTGAAARARRGCTACDLCKTRTQTVFGVGNTRAEWLVIGEAPGAKKTARANLRRPRGQLLNAMLLAIGLPRETVFIANILKCRPPAIAIRSPKKSRSCLPFLSAQIALLKPKIMLAVGRIAAQNLLATDAPLARLRGKLHRFGEATRRSSSPITRPIYCARRPTSARRGRTSSSRAPRIAHRGGGQLMAAAPEDLREVPEVHIRPMMEIDLPRSRHRAAELRVSVEREHLPRLPARGYTCRALDLAGRSSATAS
jgi:DNA polymerase